MHRTLTARNSLFACLCSLVRKCKNAMPHIADVRANTHAMSIDIMLKRLDKILESSAMVYFLQRVLDSGSYPFGDKVSTLVQTHNTANATMGCIAMQLTCYPLRCANVPPQPNLTPQVWCGVVCCVVLCCVVLCWWLCQVLFRVFRRPCEPTFCADILC